jgi:hypothetical protein
MKKSRSSIPLLEARDEEELRPPGLEGTEGRPEEPPEAAAPVRVAMAVGNTKDGSELPAKLKGGSVREKMDVVSCVAHLTRKDYAVRLILTPSWCTPYHCPALPHWNGSWWRRVAEVATLGVADQSVGEVTVCRTRKRLSAVRGVRKVVRTAGRMEEVWVAWPGWLGGLLLCLIKASLGGVGMCAAQRGCCSQDAILPTLRPEQQTTTTLYAYFAHRLTGTIQIVMAATKSTLPPTSFGTRPAATLKGNTARRIELTNLTPNNIGQLRKLNSVLLPVRYSEAFYKDTLSEERRDVCKLGKLAKR